MIERPKGFRFDPVTMAWVPEDQGRFLDNERKGDAPSGSVMNGPDPTGEDVRRVEASAIRPSRIVGVAEVRKRGEVKVFKVSRKRKYNRTEGCGGFYPRYDDITPWLPERKDGFGFKYPPRPQEYFGSQLPSSCSGCDLRFGCAYWLTSGIHICSSCPLEYKSRGA